MLFTMEEYLHLISEVKRLNALLDRTEEALKFYSKRNWRSDGIYPDSNNAKKALEEIRKGRGK